MGMRTILQSIPDHIVCLIQTLRLHLCDAHFIARHRVRPQDFTRERQLTFPIVMLFSLQKTLKSIQLHLHEFLNELADGKLFEAVTPGAWTHARAKLKHTAFIELNQTHVLSVFYGPEHSPSLKHWRTHRLLGADSSLMRLPNHHELFEQFSVVKVSNQNGHSGLTYPEGRMSVLYDLLNGVALDGRLEPSSMGEVDLAIEQLKHAKPGDVVISDRGYAGFAYLAHHAALGLDYIVRCSTASFAAAQELFRANQAGRSKVVKLFAHSGQKAQLIRQGLPTVLTVRFVSLRLPTGELEVLVTSLLDEVAYPTQEFLTVYHWRWNHETFYGVMKGRLDLENFSGQTAEAVRQDFHSTLLLCNMESLLISPAATTVTEQSAEHQHPKKINHAVAFHALKHQLLKLLYGKTPVEKVLQKLQRMFIGSAVSVRRDRKVPRGKRSLAAGYNFQRNVKKSVF